MKRVLTIADVHGHSNALNALLESVRLTKDDECYFLGDYIDHGPSSFDVINTLIALKLKYPKTKFLMGNHEEYMLEAIKDPDGFMEIWKSYGGGGLSESYKEGVPSEHKAFYAGLLDYAETEFFIFSHAGVSDNDKLSLQSSQSLRWDMLDGPIFHYSGKSVICGHTPQRTNLPTWHGNALCIDTGIVTGGRLSCVDLTNNLVTQSDKEGNTRQIALEVRQSPLSNE